MTELTTNCLSEKRRQQKVWAALLLLAAPLSSAGIMNYKQQINASDNSPSAHDQNAVIVMVEAPSHSLSGEVSNRHFAPMADDPNFKNIQLHVDSLAKTSNHSNAVAKILFGKKLSVANGITDAYIFSMSDWLKKLSAWNLEDSSATTLFPGPIVNHSWVSTHGVERDASLLRRLDYSATKFNVLHVAGVRRQGAGNPLFGGALNNLVVGGAYKNIDNEFKTVDEIYAQGRYRPHVVVPFGHSSAATPAAAATAVRLNVLAAKRRLNIDSGRGDSEQLPVELIKALIMATSRPDFEYQHKKEQLVYTFGAFGLTPNGMDKRYGMGMVDVAAAEKLLMSDPVSSNERSSSTNGQHATSGYAFEAGFGGTNGRQKDTYTIQPKRNAQLAASLVWLAKVERDGSNKLEASLSNLELCLVDVTNESKILKHTSAAGDTSENMRIELLANHTYELIVLADSDQSDPWPYALAWQITKH